MGIRNKDLILERTLKGSNINVRVGFFSVNTAKDMIAVTFRKEGFEIEMRMDVPEIQMSDIDLWGNDNNEQKTKILEKEKKVLMDAAKKATHCLANYSAGLPVNEKSFEIQRINIDDEFKRLGFLGDFKGNFRDFAAAFSNTDNPGWKKNLVDIYNNVPEFHAKENGMGIGDYNNTKSFLLYERGGMRKAFFESAVPFSRDASLGVVGQAIKLTGGKFWSSGNYFAFKTKEGKTCVGKLLGPKNKIVQSDMPEAQFPATIMEARDSDIGTMVFDEFKTAHLQLWSNHYAYRRMANVFAFGANVERMSEEKEIPENPVAQELYDAVRAFRTKDDPSYKSSPRKEWEKPERWDMKKDSPEYEKLMEYNAVKYEEPSKSKEKQVEKKPKTNSKKAATHSKSKVRQNFDDGLIPF